MTTNAYLLMWHCYGIEQIVPITQYENQMKLDVLNILKENKVRKNPLDDMLAAMLWRARFNTERSYEIYAIDCEEEITQEDLYALWDSNPQHTADFIRSTGIRLFSNRNSARPVQIT